MTTLTATLPLLRRHPDARRAIAPLLPPILLPYLALMFGSGIAALASVYNALMLKRAGLALRSLLAGTGGLVAFAVVVTIAHRLGVTNGAVLLVIGRIVHFVFGGLLLVIQRPYVRGNEFLSGRSLPLLPSYLVALLVTMNLPSKIALVLLGVPFVR